MGLMCWLKSSCSSSCRYPVISLFSFPPWVHTQGSKVSAAFREASRLLTLWLEFGSSVMMRIGLFSFLQAFTVSKHPRLHATRHIRRLDVEACLLVACPLCLCPCTCLHSAWPLSLFSCKRVPPSPDVSHPEILSDRSPAFSGCITSGILSGRSPTFSGHLTSDAWRRMGEEDNPDSPDSLARQTLAIRRIHFRPQSSAPLDFNRHECYFFHNSRIMEFVILIHAI